jgi:hypothetical protein
MTTVSYGRNSLDYVTDLILGCTLDSTEASNAQGPDASVRKFKLTPMKILFNGTDDVLISQVLASLGL